MNLLPSLLAVRYRHKGWLIPTLYFPLILLWPLFFLVLFGAFIAALVAVAILDTRSVKRVVELFGGAYAATCELRGTRVDVEDRDNRILITIR